MSTPETNPAPPHRPEDQKSPWKVIAVAAVIAAGVAKPNFAPGTVLHVGCEIVVAIGAAFGIASAGLSRK